MSELCIKCGVVDDEFIEYDTRLAIAQYGTIVLCTAICTHCGSTIFRDKIIDDDGLHPDKRQFK